MVRHGPEFDFEAGVSAQPLERVWWFGPGRCLAVGVSSMPEKDASHECSELIPGHRARRWP